MPPNFTFISSGVLAPSQDFAQPPVGKRNCTTSSVASTTPLAFDRVSTRTPLTEQHRLQRLLSDTPASERAAAKDAIPILLAEASKQGVTDHRQQAYILATVEHESHFGSPGFATERASGKAYEGNLELGNVLPGDGPKYKGHGFTQPTGRIEYTYYQEKTGVDLVNHPEKANDAKVGAFIAVHAMKNGTFSSLTFAYEKAKDGTPSVDPKTHTLKAVAHRTAAGGHKLDEYFNAHASDYVGARNIVNGNDSAELIANQAKAYAKDLGAK